MLALGSSKKSHRERIVTLAFAIRLKTLGNADKRGRSDAPFVRFLGRAKRKHCEICVRLNHLCEGILVRLPDSGQREKCFYLQAEIFLIAGRNHSICK